MFDATDDPLGIAVQQRAREQRWQRMLAGQQPSMGPLPDPRWEGFFQAVSEAGGERPVRYGYVDEPSPDVARDLFSQAAADPRTTHASLEGLRSALSAQLGTPTGVPYDPYAEKRR